MEKTTLDPQGCIGEILIIWVSKINKVCETAGSLSLKGGRMGMVNHGSKLSSEVARTLFVWKIFSQNQYFIK